MRSSTESTMAFLRTMPATSPATYACVCLYQLAVPQLRLSRCAYHRAELDGGENDERGGVGR
jgi:hypothetical protein